MHSESVCKSYKIRKKQVKLWLKPKLVHGLMSRIIPDASLIKTHKLLF